MLEAWNKPQYRKQKSVADLKKVMQQIWDNATQDWSTVHGCCYQPPEMADRLCNIQRWIILRLESAQQLW